MTLLPRADNVAERMDEPDVDPAHLAEALDDVASINRWLGARRALIRTLPEALARTDGTAARVVDVGTGSADLPVAALDWARKRNTTLDIAAVDPHPGTLRAARQRTEHARIRLIRADGRRLPFATGSFDLALLSMTLHHMEGPDQLALLRELARVARGGRVLVAELERSLPHYWGARFLAATLWRANPVTRHDAPLSVRRSFTPRELVALARSAGLQRPRVRRHFFYRLVLLADA